MEQKRKSLKKLLIVLSIVLAVLLVAAAVMFFVADSFLDKIGRLDNQPTLSQDQLETIFGEGETVETDPILGQAETIFSGKDTVNILLVGQDKREGDEPQRTDAMILCTLNKATKTLTMTSFMRDVWVYIPGHYNQRLNLAYMLGGFPLLNDTLEYNFGVRADYNIEIDFSGFMKAIDIIGGVDIELTSAEAKYLNKRGNWDIEENQHWTLKEGVNHLTGSQALAYSRIRKTDSDFKRTNRQRIVLTALIDKAKTLSTTEIYSLAKEIIPLLRTDMRNSQIFGLMLDGIQMMSDLQTVSQRIPMDGQYGYANKNGASVIVLNEKQLKANIQMLIDTIGEQN